jgi:hypothetical protein
MKSIACLVILAVTAVFPLLSEDGGGQVTFVFIIDFDDFMCFSCLESFVNFCHSLPDEFRRDHCLGVLTLPSGRENPSVMVQIMHKKLRGFTKANHIDFPVVVDHPMYFSAIGQRGSCLLVFQAGELKLDAHPFPLSGKTADAVRDLIL